MDRLQLLLIELLSHYFDEPIEDITEVPYGLTNYSQIVTVDEKKYVARIYDVHSKNLKRLIYEIELTTFLEQNKLSFRVPEFKQARNGEKYIVLSNGQLGSVVHFIEGEAPDLIRLSDVEQYGVTVGALSAALQGFNSDMIVQDIHFHRIYNLHPLANEQAVNEFLAHPPFEIVNATREVIFSTMLALQDRQFQIDSLPKQIIHHDLLIFNMLIDKNSRRMNGVLDFDFASQDVRALELAICINHMLQYEEDLQVKLKLFIDEYAQYISLTREEIKWIPFLMRLYYVSLLCIYIGQHNSGKKIQGYFDFISLQLVNRTRWLERNEQELLALLESKFV